MTYNWGSVIDNKNASNGQETLNYSISFGPGLSYFITKNLLIEMSLGSIQYMVYDFRDDTENVNEFYFNFPSIGFGIKYLIDRE